MYDFHARWSTDFPHQVCIALADTNTTLCGVFLNFFGCWYPIESSEIESNLMGYVFCSRCVLQTMQQVELERTKQ